MNPSRCTLALLLLALVVPTVSAIDRLPIADFARQPDTLGARLSPDGKHLAFLRDHFGKVQLHVADLATNGITRFDLGPAHAANEATKEVVFFRWANSDRIIVGTSVWDSFYGVVAIGIDGGRFVPISGMEDNKVNDRHKLWTREVIHSFNDAEGHVLMLDRHEGRPGSHNRPDVLKVNTTTGSAVTIVKNPGGVGSWGVDAAGVVRVGMLSHGDLSGAIYREDERTDWRTILPLEDRRGGMRPVGFNAATNSILLAALTAEKRWTMFPLDPDTGVIGEPLLVDPEYDILPERFTPTIDGLSLCAPIASPAKDALLGLRYVTDAPRVRWFDPQFAAAQKTMDRTQPDTVNLVVDITRDMKQVLWFCFSDRHPGSYLLVDTEKRSIKPLASRMNWIKYPQMGRTHAIHYVARDGIKIHGYLTVPAGHEPRNLPLVVMPHGGPWVRDIWGFDPLVQLLANRGYGVLQMNYRGSPGYGQELYLGARLQIGGAIQDDIEDATTWALTEGVADPKRVAIVGGSYGGYSTLFALGKSPGMYRCGIAINAVTDWPDIFDERKSNPDFKNANRHWRREIGDPEKDAERLRAVSPVNFADQITAPLLIIHGRKDRIVPVDQSRAMIKALNKAGHKPRELIIGQMGHSLGTEKIRTEVFTAVVEFLEEQLGPGLK